MRLPLIVHASPTSLSKGPSVLLREGKWIVDCMVKDTEFEVVIVSNLQEHRMKREDTLEVSSPTSAYLLITKPGTESSISVDLVRTP